MERESFGTRLGFILIAAGCAIGLGNVWRFPWITGQYGGGAFVLMYLIFLVILGVPIMAMEFATGRGSKRGIAGSFNALEPKGSKWHVYKWFAIGGNFLLMMFYTMVCGWMFNYVFKYATGVFNSMGAADAAGKTITSTSIFLNMIDDPIQMIVWMVIVIAAGILVCSIGLQKGVEKITKVMMIGLLALILVLVGRCISLPGATAGLEFYLKPDFSKIFSSFDTFSTAAYAAMGQSFFTLSIGIGSMAIFGSYIDRKKRLLNEAATIAGLDTLIALLAGLMIFPACSAFNISPTEGSGLAFMTLPNVFDSMAGGQIWGCLFFLFLGFAAFSTVIAVFENIVAFGMDQWGWSRKKSCGINFVALIILCTPAVLGCNVWSFVGLPGIPGFTSIDAIEDFIVSNNLLPIGSLIFVLFCTSKRGWGWKNFMEEVNAGSGLRFPQWMLNWMRFGVPILVVVILIMGWIPTITSIAAAIG